MNARVEEVFLAAIERPSPERAAFVAARCGDDAALLAEVRSLLRYHEDSEPQARDDAANANRGHASGGVNAGGDGNLAAHGSGGQADRPVDGSHGSGDGSGGRSGSGSSGFGFLDSKAAPGRGLLTRLGARALSAAEPVLAANRQIGPFTVLGVLGQGGMGVVYLAKQDRPSRTVALKVMRRGVSDAKLKRRFEYEAELLGRLRHPGIAQVYQAGTFREELSGTDHPYIAMELVRGKTLTAHARDAKLSTRQKLDLMARVCDAVQHAHLSGVIHRDIKPANVLVDESGQPKILDFGVARDAGGTSAPGLALTTVHTGLGELVGTLPYMSPEQVGSSPMVTPAGGHANQAGAAEGSGDANGSNGSSGSKGCNGSRGPHGSHGSADHRAVDARSDVYALGVVLYELLTGQLPHDFGTGSLLDSVRLIREGSVRRLSTIDRSLRGEIEVIAGKALEKSVSRRYQSAAQLGADIRAYLEGRPIAARQDSTLYVLGKQVRRHKGVVAAAALFLVGAIAFAVYATVEAKRNARLADAALREQRRAESSLKVAQSERTRADSTAAELARQLSVSNVERARLMGAGSSASGGGSSAAGIGVGAVAGTLRNAEDLLWPEHLKDLNSRYTFYALWELYASAPRLAALPCPPEAAFRDRFAEWVSVSPDGAVVAAAGVGRGAGLMVWSSHDYAVLFKEPATQCNAVAFWAGVADAAGPRAAPAEGHEQGGPERHGGPRQTAPATLVVGTRSGAVQFRDAATGAIRGEHRLTTVEGSPAASRGVSGLDTHGPTGRLVAASHDGAIAVWEPGGEQPAAARKLDGSPLRSPVFSPDGSRIAAGAGQGRLIVFDAKTLRTVFTTRVGDDLLTSVAWSPKGDVIAAGGDARVVRVFNAADGRPITVLDVPNGIVRGMNFNGEGSRLYTGGWWAILEWDTATWTIKRRLPAAGSTQQFAVDTDRHVLWSAGGAGVEAWDIRPEPGRTGVAGVGDGVSRPVRTLVRWVPWTSGETEELLAGEGNGEVAVLTGPEWSERTVLGDGPRRVRSIAMHPAQPWAASLGIDGKLKLWNVAERKLIAEWPGFRTATNRSVVFDRAGERLLAPLSAGGFACLEVPSGRVMWTIAHDGFEPLAGTFSQDGQMVAVTTRRHFLTIHDAQTGRLVRECALGPSTPWVPLFTADGKRVLAGSWGRTIDIWDVQTGKLVRQLSGHGGLVTDLAFRPGEPDVVASAGADGTLRLWDLSLPIDTPVLTLGGFGGWEVWALDFHPRGTRLLGTNSRGLTVIWDLRYFNRHIGGNLRAALLRIQEVQHQTGATNIDDDAVGVPLLPSGAISTVVLPSEDKLAEHEHLLLNRGQRSKPPATAADPAAALAPSGPAASPVADPPGAPRTNP